MPSIAFMSSGLSSKLNTWKEGTITLTSPPRRQPPPWGWRSFQLDRDTRRGQGSRVCPQLPGEQPGTLCWVLTSPSHTSFSVHLTNITVHQSLIFLSESLVTENKLKIFFFQTHCLWTLLTRYWTWADIRLIASPQHALRVTAFSWSSVGRRLPHDSLFRNLISNYSLSMIEPN